MSAGRLTPADLAHLAGSWITPEFAAQAGIDRVESYRGAELVGRKDGSSGMGRYSGLVFPNRLPGEQHERGYRLKLDNPEYEIRNGEKKPKQKYLAASGSRNQLYFVPGTSPDDLKNAALPIAITEGEKKTIALYRLARHERETPEFLSVGVTGVWNWKGTVGKANGPMGERIDIKGVIPDFEHIQWQDRTVYIIFDADWQANESVGWARKMLARELSKRGANVFFVDIPAEAHVKAIDDLLVAWGPERVRELFANPTRAASLVKQTPANFEEKDGRLIRYKAGKSDSIEEIPLANFTARIVKDIHEDDGTETRRLCGIEAMHYDRPYSFVIPATRFQAMDWPIEFIAPDAIVWPNQKDYARAAIQSLSLNIEEHRIYTHTGWRQVNGIWVYLHSGGAVGPGGLINGIDVRLTGMLAAYKLRLAKDPARLKAAVVASLGILKLAPAHIVYPVLGAVYRAALKTPDFVLWVAGPTGVFKSELAALAQQHYGAEMTSRRLPGNFASTGNALESLAFLAKDALVVVDDFAPHGGAQDVARYHGTADRLLRAAGNTQGRGRLTSDAKLREAKPPRGLIFATGEDVPKGQSIRGRTLILEIAQGDVMKDVLTECQREAASGLYAEAMGGFVQYVAADYDRIQNFMTEQAVALRAGAVKAHSRTPGIVAELQAGFEVFLRYALAIGAVSERRAAELKERAWDALNAAGKLQGGLQKSSEPARRFVELLRSAVNAGIAHVAAMSGEKPEDGVFWGWRDEGADGHARWVGKGNRIGWTDLNNLYLDPIASYAVAQDVGRRTGEPLVVTERSLNKRLNETGLLASTEPNRQTLTVRRTLQGKQMAVLHFSVATFCSDVGFPVESVGFMSGISTQPDSGLRRELSYLEQNVGNVGFSRGEERARESEKAKAAELEMEVIEL